MTRNEAYSAMAGGKLVRHSSFSGDEFLSMKDGVVRDENDYDFSEGWAMRTGGSWEDGGEVVGMDAAQTVRMLAESAIRKLDKITRKMRLQHVDATVASKSVNWADAGSARHVNDLLDEINEFLGIK